jgi:Na+-translocating ferredoxin:NAD+ oxidoreductase RnfE subunit
MSKRKTLRRRFWQAADSFVETAVTKNLVLTQAIGICPIIAAGVTLQNGVALTACTAAVLLPLSLLMPLIGNRLPRWLRPVLYVLLAALALVGASYLLETRISPELYARLYAFIPLIAVNMLRAHSSTMTRTMHPMETIIEALGSTLGFGAVICIISAIREVTISATLWGIPVGSGFTLPEAAAPFAAFIMLGFMSALLQWTRHRIAAYFRRKEAEHQ